MASIATVMELQPADCHKSQEAGNNQRCNTPPNCNLLMEQILEDLSTTPQNEVLKRIASLHDIRRGKVLNIHRQITKGTYPINDRLEIAADRIMESIST